MIGGEEMKNLKIYLGAFMSVLFILVGCGTSTDEPSPDTESDADAKKLQVVTTLFPQYDFVRQIAGEKVEVTKLLPIGVDAHSFEPTPSDIVSVNQADLFIYTGQEMEPWAHRITQSIDNDDVSVLDVSDNIKLRATDDHDHHHDHDHDHDHHHDHDHDHDHHHDHGHDHDHHHDHDHDHDHDHNHDHDHEGCDHSHDHDPHIWTSPVNAKVMVDNILNALIELDPENEAYYRENAEAYLDELNQLDADFREVVEQAQHDTIYHGGRFAMHYLMDEYGLNYVAAPFETEPSAALVAQMITEIEELEIPAIFHEELVNPQISQMISDETGATMLLLHSLHNVSNEELEAGVTYLSLMQQNVENLKLGLN